MTHLVRDQTWPDYPGLIEPGRVHGSLYTDPRVFADELARLSPEGKVELTAGWLKHRTRANWKLLAESETDGYHPQFVHGSIFSVTGSPIGAIYGDKSTAVTRDLGHGHSENDLRPEFRRIGEPMRWFGTNQARVPGYVARMREVYGEAAEQILVEGAPHVMVFPNLFVAEIQDLRGRGARSRQRIR